MLVLKQHLITLAKQKIINSHYRKKTVLIFLTYIFPNTCVCQSMLYIYLLFVVFFNRIFHFVNRIMFICKFCAHNRYRLCGSEAYKIWESFLRKCFKMMNTNICTGPWRGPCKGEVSKFKLHYCPSNSSLCSGLNFPPT